MHDSFRLRVGVVLYDGFELLDACGPLGVFGRVSEVDVQMLASDVRQIRSRQGVYLLADRLLNDANDYDLLVVPGGQGTRDAIKCQSFLSALGDAISSADCVAAVCTGSALLAAAGALEGYHATSNFLAFDWVAGYGNDVKWIKGVRWVHDRDRWTSGGVTAGIDMSLALLGHYFGETRMEDAASELEYIMHPGLSFD